MLFFNILAELLTFLLDWKNKQIGVRHCGDACFIILDNYDVIKFLMLMEG